VELVGGGVGGTAGALEADLTEGNGGGTGTGTGAGDCSLLVLGTLGSGGDIGLVGTIVFVFEYQSGDFLE